MRILKFLLFIAILFPTVGKAQSVSIDTVKSAPGITIETAVDKSEIYIGDLINYRLTVIHDSTIVLTPPPIGANLGAFDVKDYQADEEVRLPSGQIKLESRFLLTTFTTGDYVIPPIPVEFMLPDSSVKYLISEPTPIRVKSLLAESADTSDIRDIKGPIAFKEDRTIYYILGGILLLLLVGGYLYWRIRRRRLGVTSPLDTRKPWEIAYEQLAVLEAKKYLPEKKFKLFYIELTDIIRAFLGRVYQIPALDMTTEEFLEAAEKTEIPVEIKERLEAFLKFADLVKFAKLLPEPEKPAADFEEARLFVEQIRLAETAKMAPAVTSGGGSHV
ncbi:MAG: hypothetical protein HRF51_06105 [bacterium]|jgi:hypothetical protein